MSTQIGNTLTLKYFVLKHELQITHLLGKVPSTVRTQCKFTRCSLLLASTAGYCGLECKKGGTSMVGQPTLTLEKPGLEPSRSEPITF